MSYFGQSVEDESFNALVPIERFYPDLAPNTVSNATSESPSEPLFQGTRILYWYHPDYVSNVDLVTDVNGEAYEQFLYNAWGECLHHWTSNSSNSWSSPYRFNSKELDPETGMHYYGARFHNPKLSIWLSVDKYSHKGPGLSPYIYSANNPIMLIDLDGNWPYEVYIRSFHPSQSFGGGYDGDKRGWSIDPNASSRIHHRVTANHKTGEVIYTGRGKDGTYSDPSYHPDKGYATETPDGYIGKVVAGENSVEFETGYEGANPLLWYAPEIDVDAKISISQEGNILNVSSKVAGDDFPNTELMISDTYGNTVMLGVDKRAANNDDRPDILFGPATEVIINVDVQIMIDQNTGQFLKIQYQGKWIEIDTWNQMQLQQDV